MKRQEMICGATVRIHANDRLLEFGHNGYGISRESAPQLIAFIEQWLAHDPEQELVKRVNCLLSDWDTPDATTEIIKAVREHDKLYGSA